MLFGERDWLLSALPGGFYNKQASCYAQPPEGDKMNEVFKPSSLAKQALQASVESSRAEMNFLA